MALSMVEAWLSRDLVGVLRVAYPHKTRCFRAIFPRSTVHEPVGIFDAKPFGLARACTTLREAHPR